MKRKDRKTGRTEVDDEAVHEARIGANGEGDASGHQEIVPGAPPESEEAEADGLVADLAELQDRHLRLAAEFENYRKRTRRELAEMRVRSHADLAGRLLDSLDDLDRVAGAPPDAPADSLREGIGLVRLKLHKELNDAGLSKIEAAGQPFDPNLHEALTTRPTEDPATDGTVAEVLTEGYALRDILVRPARVVVYKYDPGTAPSDGSRPDATGAKGPDGEGMPPEEPDRSG